LMIGGRLIILVECPVCGVLLPVGNRFCSLACYKESCGVIEELSIGSDGSV